MPNNPDQTTITITKATKAKIDKACRFKKRLDKRNCTIDYAIDQAMDDYIARVKDEIEKAKG